MCADEDEDELNYQSTTRVARKPRTEKSKNSGSKGKGGKKGKSEANTTGTRKLGQGATANKGAAQQRQSMTYTRKKTQNTSEAVDENELVDSGDDESGEDERRSGGRGVLMDQKARQEMKKLAAKFREVDDWGLEFEEVTGSSDRMRDAR